MSTNDSLHRRIRDVRREKTIADPDFRFGRRACLVGAVAVATGAIPRWCRGQTPSGDNRVSIDPSALYSPDQIDQSVSAAIDYLVRTQREDGSIADRGHEIAMTSLAIMSMASIGVLPGSSDPRGRAMDRAIEYVLRGDKQDPQGYFGRADSSRMYGHGITTLMLTEILGMGSSVEQNRRIHDALEKAIALILASQKVHKDSQHQGGWRYSPDSRDSDLSITVWQVMALRSANNDGLSVPGEAIEQAVKYLENSFAKVGSRGDRMLGGFAYTPGSNHPTFPMTSAGLLAMQVCGRYDSPMVQAAADWLLSNGPEGSTRFLFYGLYYYAQGMHQYGGRHAETAEKVAIKWLLPTQRGDGAFEGQREERNSGAVYSTAMAVLSLTVRYHYLPIYQR